MRSWTKVEKLKAEQATSLIHFWYHKTINLLADMRWNENEYCEHQEEEKLSLYKMHESEFKQKTA